MSQGDGIFKLIKSTNTIANESKNYWLKNEASCGILANKYLNGDENAEFFAGENHVAACLVKADQLLSTPLNEEQAQSLAELCFKKNFTVPGLFIANPGSHFFAASYSKLTEKEFSVVKSLGHYELSELAMEKIIKHQFILAKEKDIEELINHRQASQEEENTQRPYDSRASVLEDMKYGRLHLLKDEAEQILCSGSLNLDRSNRSGYINHVYTSPQLRCCGYATELVERMSRRILSMGRIPSLSVDIENTNAIKVYEKLGFARKCIMDNIKFDD